MSRQVFFFIFRQRIHIGFIQKFIQGQSVLRFIIRNSTSSREFFFTFARRFNWQFFFFQCSVICTYCVKKYILRVFCFAITLFLHDVCFLFLSLPSFYCSSFHCRNSFLSRISPLFFPFVYRVTSSLSIFFFTLLSLERVFSICSRSLSED